MTCASPALTQCRYGVGLADPCGQRLSLLVDPEALDAALRAGGLVAVIELARSRGLTYRPMGGGHPVSPVTPFPGAP